MGNILRNGWNILLRSLKRRGRIPTVWTKSSFTKQTNLQLQLHAGGTSGGLGKRGHNAQQGSLRENTDCRICKYLKTNGWRGPYPPFKNHLDSSPMGCPNFLSNTTENRKQMAISIKMCLVCLDPKVT